MSEAKLTTKEAPPLPSRIELGYMSILIEEVDEIDIPEDAIGIYHRAQNRIRIRKGLSRTERANTLVHELFHAIYKQYRLSTEVDDAEEVEELVVNSMANGWIELLRRNPKLWEFLLQELPQPPR